MNGTVDIEAARAALEEALVAWLPRQRWYGGGQVIRSVRCVELSPLGVQGADVALCVAAVEHADLTQETYNVPVALSSPGGLRPSDPAAIIHADTETLIFDALADARSAAPLWRVLASGSEVQLRSGRLTVGGGGLDPSTPDIAPLAREQSNTSLVVGGQHLLKVMRKLAFEPSVELEMTRALDEAGFHHLAPPQAWLRYERDDRPNPALLAIAQPFLHNGTEGWTLAMTSLRDLYADAEEHLPGDAVDRTRAVEDAGGSFTAEAARLGDITAQMHLALARATGPDLAPEPITQSLLNEWADEVIAELGALIGRGDEALSGLPAHRDALEARANSIRTLRQPGLAIRIHGDYHLGQVLRTDSGWTVLDFEGEPRRPVEHRRRRHSPLRDVAGMLRSFDYAASVALLERLTPADQAWEHVRAHGLSWAAANREAFWATYVERTAGTALLPDPGAALTLRRAFEIQKSIYEVGYELAHRPQWVPVPLGFLLEATP
ncbi:MAG TPA: hypothetical protein VLO10_06590 [Candidatus Deferrimicrobium sp.]|nr:hypothetical protein [Candidatus Deferrimicrobium sp.]